MPETKLTDRMRREIVRRALEGESPTPLAEEYHVTPMHVWRLKQEALEAPLASWREATEELEFRAWVLAHHS